MSEPKIAATPENALRRCWGYDSFKPLQREAVEAALSGRDCLVVLPTGGGKSLCYQLPAAMGRGLVLVVSPLIALMDDQVAAAREAGLAADALHSNLEAGRRGEAYRRLTAGKTEILYVSPERLLLGDLLEDIAPRLILAAVDEAHCVSHWGHEFRPEYRRLAEVLERFPKAARMALTATATPPVQEDIRAQLALRRPLSFIGHPDRANLVYRAFPRRDQAAQVLQIVRRHRGEGGVVYAQTRKDVDRLAAGLAGEGVSCAAYHAGLPADRRRRAQDDFVNERLDVVVATIAFGMGIDRSNVRYVLHANTPRSVEHYQQESGRAGCDVCLGETKSLSAAEALLTAKKVLSGAWRAGGRYGTGYVVNLLLGRADDRMTRNGHDALQVFGLLKEPGEAAVRSWIDQLIVQDFLEVVEEREYPLLRITETGKALCRDEGTVRLGVPAPPTGRTKKKPGRGLRGVPSGLAPDEDLFERLRRLRRLISERSGVPPYMVFHDSALVEMAALKPRTPDALRAVKGVGERKLERYGAAFLEVIGGAPPESAAIC